MRRVVPVLDVRRGEALRAEGGSRTDYGPLRSIFHSQSDPKSVGEGIFRRMGRVPLYLADLEAIGGGEADRELVYYLRSIGLEVWLDAGVRRAGQVRGLREAGARVVVAGLETVEGPEALGACVEEAGREFLAFSLDLKGGRPMVETRHRWGTDEPMELVERAIELGVRRLIVLDLARVGTGRGSGTLELVGTIHRRWPDVEITAGGGVGGLGDVDAMRERGASWVLVGSALHDGRIPVEAVWAGLDAQAASSRAAGEADGSGASKGTISSR